MCSDYMGAEVFREIHTLQQKIPYGESGKCIPNSFPVDNSKSLTITATARGLYQLSVSALGLALSPSCHWQFDLENEQRISLLQLEENPEGKWLVYILRWSTKQNKSAQVSEIIPKPLVTVVKCAE